MPELPEVETVKRGLMPAMLDRRIERVEQRRANLRFAFPDNFAARLTGRTVTSLERRAKYLLADLDDGTVLVMHLGMSGSFRIEGDIPGAFHHARSRLSAHDHVVLHLGEVRVTYNDPRRFGFMLLVPRSELASHPLFANIGMEPLGNELSAASLAELFAGRSTSLKAALLDQRLVAGIGNIYACEALHRSHLSPLRAAGTLSTKSGKPSVKAERLAQAIRTVLTEAVAAGGSSLRDHAQTNGELGYFQHTFRVYDREHAPCPTEGCRGTVKRITQNGRSTFYCPICQT